MFSSSLDVSDRRGVRPQLLVGVPRPRASGCVTNCSRVSRHVFDAEMKERRRTHGNAGHEHRPLSDCVRIVALIPTKMPSTDYGLPMADREGLSWDQFGAATRQLAASVVADGFSPDLDPRNARGGFFVAGALGYALDVKNVHMMNVEYYTGVDAAPGCAGDAAARCPSRRPRRCAGADRR